jgi:hypothetical protein
VEGRGVALYTSTARDLGAFVCFEDSDRPIGNTSSCQFRLSSARRRKDARTDEKP